MDQKLFDDMMASQSDEFKQATRGLAIASSLFDWITIIHPEMIPDFVEWLSEEVVLQKPQPKTELINRLNETIKWMIETKKINK